MESASGSTTLVGHDPAILQKELIRVWWRGLARLDGQGSRLDALQGLHSLEALQRDSPWTLSPRRVAVREMLRVALLFLPSEIDTTSWIGSAGDRERLDALFGLSPTWRSHDRSERWEAATAGIGELDRRRSPSTSVRRNRDEVWRRSATTLMAESLVRAAQARFQVDSSLSLSRPTGGMPQATSILIGRESALERFVKVADTKHVVLGGASGIGKTALVVALAARLSSTFPDGTVFIDAHGYGALRPLSLEEIVRRILVSLGYSLNNLPSDVGHLGSVYRTVLSTRRVLLVLDNVASRTIAMDLVGNAGAARVLITTRDSLALNVESVVSESLNPLTNEESIRVIESFVGRERVQADLPDAQRIAEIAGGLPLALTLIGSAVATQRSARLAQIAQQLELGEPRYGTVDFDARDARVSLQWSIDRLADGPRQLINRLAHLTLYGFGEEVVRTLGGTDWREDLEILLERRLLLEGGAPGYTFHDLTRTFLASPSSSMVSAEERSEWLALAFNAITESMHQLESEYSQNSAILWAREFLDRRVPLTTDLRNHPGVRRSFSANNAVNLLKDADPTVAISCRYDEIAVTLTLIGEFEGAVKCLEWSRDVLLSLPQPARLEMPDSHLKVPDLVRDYVLLFGARSGWHQRVVPLVDRLDALNPPPSKVSAKVRIERVQKHLYGTQTVDEFITMLAMLRGEFTLNLDADESDTRVGQLLEFREFVAGSELRAGRSLDDGESVLELGRGLEEAVAYKAKVASADLGWDIGVLYLKRGFKLLAFGALDEAAIAFRSASDTYKATGFLGHMVKVNRLLDSFSSGQD